MSCIIFTCKLAGLIFPFSSCCGHCWVLTYIFLLWHYSIRDTSIADADADDIASRVRNLRRIWESILAKILTKPSRRIKKDSYKVLKSVQYSCQTCLENLNGFPLSVTNFQKFVLLASSKSTLNSLSTLNHTNCRSWFLPEQWQCH